MDCRSELHVTQVMDYIPMENALYIHVHYTLYMYMYSILVASQIQSRLIYQNFISLATTIVSWVSVHGHLNVTCDFSLHGHYPEYIHMKAAALTP